ncbi:All-trans-phytoene synthase [Calycomorphotria hydatis]|uniref:All-trans-phytoene synthase n=2 Tax=Calycomorphotria hydatis TaxID=2528027 RepID=A0A517TCQ5_9PLAN|nr:All-trans-phytoene synthase [Calycomorphotria hydatis]
MENYNSTWIVDTTAVDARELAESYRHCVKLARRRAGNFYFSFLTLPRQLRHEMCALYAYMRECDDIADDEAVPIDVRRERLQTWRAEVADALETGNSQHPALPAFVDVVRRRRIPREYLFDVIEGVGSDLEPVEITTFSELEQYCYRVAGVVGLCCIHIWGFRDERAIQPAIDCGLAFQLTNIIRDVREDALSGRCYLPSEELAQFGCDQQDFTAKEMTKATRSLIEFQIDRAQDCYQRAGQLFESIDPAGHSVLAAMLGIYGQLLNKISRDPAVIFQRRVKLSRARKLRIATQAYFWPQSISRAMRQVRE